VDEALTWLGADDSDRRELADPTRWQESPWTVFGWADAAESGAEVSGGSARVYGEGGALPPR
jgi:hypothetical protein